MITDERKIRIENVIAAGRMIMTAARTAPKAKGVDIQEISLVSGDELVLLAEEMRRQSETRGLKFFLRDAANVEQSQAALIIGTKHKVQGLNCGYCGFPTCTEKPEGIPCYFNAADVGIALGSAVSLAADMRVDTRIMFSAGVAARDLGYVKDCESVLAVLLSCSSKSPFFDRVFERK